MLASFSVQCYHSVNRFPNSDKIVLVQTLQLLKLINPKALFIYGA